MVHNRHLNPSKYGPALASVLAEPRRPELGPGRANESMREQLEKLDVAQVCAGRPVADESMARACLAGVWLYHDFLDESHRISQEIETPTGSYWHGIMHRREPDYSNAKYWFRRVGRHGVFDPLAEVARQLALPEVPAAIERCLAAEGWDPFAFVDACQAAQGDGGKLRELCQEIQLAEWELLFDACHRVATGA